jgi:hypothetical protein
MSFKERILNDLQGKSKQEQLDILQGWQIYIEVSTDFLSRQDHENLDTLYQMQKQIEVSL